MNKHCMSVASLRVGTPLGFDRRGSYLVIIIITIIIAYIMRQKKKNVNDKSPDEGWKYLTVTNKIVLSSCVH